MRIDIDIENIDSLENREKLSILSSDILIELLLRNIKEVANYKNITKEIREYIEKHIAIFKNGNMLVDMNIDELLGILNKENKE